MEFSSVPAVETETTRAISSQTRTRSASYQPYEDLYQKIKNHVAKHSKSISRRYSKRLDSNQTPCGSDSEKGENENELGWESGSDTNNEFEDEELVEFRKDFESAATSRPAVYFADDKTLADMETVPFPVKTEMELQEQFNSELSKAHILAEFHERYINCALQRSRLQLPQDALSLRQDAKRCWEEAVHSNPLQFLENIGRSLAMNAGTSSVLNIKEINECITIAPSAQSFSQYIPNETPQLNYELQ